MAISRKEYRAASMELAEARDKLVAFRNEQNYLIGLAQSRLAHAEREFARLEDRLQPVKDEYLEQLTD